MSQQQNIPTDDPCDDITSSPNWERWTTPQEANNT